MTTPSAAARPFEASDGSQVDINSASFDAVACIDSLLGEGAVGNTSCPKHCLRAALRLACVLYGMAIHQSDPWMPWAAMQ